MSTQPNRIQALQQLLRERIVILDGAMGTTIQQYQLTEEQFRGDRFGDWKGKDLKGNNELLNLTQPHIIQEIHRRYFEAGADIVETNTFNGQFISLADYGMESLAHELSFAGAQCARRAADEVMAAHPGRHCWVAGAIGPTTKTSSISTDVNDASSRGTTWDELVGLTASRCARCWTAVATYSLSKPFLIRSTPRRHFLRSSMCLMNASCRRCRSARSLCPEKPLCL